jgi:hypothetical protein
MSKEATPAGNCQEKDTRMNALFRGIKLTVGKVTGKLINKERLKIVHATMSIEAKNLQRCD